MVISGFGKTWKQAVEMVYYGSDFGSCNGILIEALKLKTSRICSGYYGSCHRKKITSGRIHAALRHTEKSFDKMEKSLGK